MVNNKRYTVALLGGGPRGVVHLEAFLANADRFEVVALCDKDEGALAKFSALCPAAKTYDDGEAMMAETKPDVFCFNTLPHIRLPLIELGVKHGVKAIAYEKPMALSLAEARQITDLCSGAGVKTIVSQQHKYGEHWKRVRDVAVSGAIGDIHTIHATAKGWLLQYGTHLLDYMTFLNGGSPAQWVTGHVHGGGKLKDTHPSPDYAIGHIGFENGVRGIIECGYLAPDLPHDNSFWMDAGATVYGSEGYAQVIVGYGTRIFTKADGLVETPGGFDVHLDQPPYIRDLADWLDDPEKVHPCNGDDVYRDFQIVMGVALSSIDHRKVERPVESETPILKRLEAILDTNTNNYEQWGF